MRVAEMRLAFALILIATVTPADACHRFAIWKYPFPQRCSVAKAPVYPLPPIKAPDMPLPNVGFDDPPDADGEQGERLKALGLMRQLKGTN